MDAIQLELDFRSAIAQALAEPEDANLSQLWLSLEPELVGLTEKEQLAMAGQALCDLAEVCQRRAELMWTEWQDFYNTEGPIPDEDFLAGLVQKTMFLDISELVRQPKSRKKAFVGGEDRGDSIVEEVTKTEALLLAGVEEEEKPIPVALLEHDEAAGAWAAALREWMRERGVEEVRFPDLMSGVGLSVVKIWLALLLGDFELRQEGGFYEGAGIMVELAAADLTASVPEVPQRFARV
jgi:hypothetical protein